MSIELDNEQEPMILKPSNSTDSNKLANSIIANHQNKPEQIIIVRAIGAGALNQAVKAIIIANKYFVKKGCIHAIVASFNDITPNLTSIELRLKLIRV